jgi:hypothetical protein
MLLRLSLLEEGRGEGSKVLGGTRGVLLLGVWEKSPQWQGSRCFLLDGGERDLEGGML